MKILTTILKLSKKNLAGDVYTNCEIGVITYSLAATPACLSPYQLAAIVVGSSVVLKSLIFSKWLAL